MSLRTRAAFALSVAVAAAVSAAAPVLWAQPTPAPGAVVEGSADADARVDWTRGLVIATGAAAADLRAPSAEIARVRAERQARERALASARARAGQLATSGGAAAVEPDVAAGRLDRLVARDARDLDVRYGSDGSATVTVSVPLEGIRLALSGPPAPVSGAPDGDAPTAVIVDARSLRGVLRPRLGLRVAYSGTEIAAPTVYTTDLAAARADPRLGERAVEAAAQGYSRGVLTLRGGAGLDKLSAARQPLVVVVLKARRGGGRAR